MSTKILPDPIYSVIANHAKAFATATRKEKPADWATIDAFAETLLEIFPTTIEGACDML
jgi:hypothetical protein